MKLNILQRLPILLVVVCLVIHFISPASATYYGDIENYPVYTGDFPYSGGGYLVCVDLQAEANGYSIWFFVAWFENPSSLTAFYDKDNNLSVTFTGNFSYRYYSYVKSDGSFVEYLYPWTEPVSGGSVRLFDVVYSDFPIYFANGKQAFPAVPSTPSTLGSVTLWHNEDLVHTFDNIPFPVKVSVCKDNTNQVIRFLDPETNYTYESLQIFDYDFYGVSVGHNTVSPQHYFNTDFIMETPEDLYLFWDTDILTSLGDTLLYDYTGSSLLDTFPGVFPVIIKVTDNGIDILDCFEDVPTWQYEYSGSGIFAGISTEVNDTEVQFGPGSTLVLSQPSDLYLITEEDLASSGEDPGGDDSGDDSGEDPGGDTGGDSGGGSGDDSGGDDSGENPGGDDGVLDGSGLGNSSGNISGGNIGLGGVVGDMNGMQGLLPDIPDNVGDILSGYLSGAADSPAFGLMLWNDPEYGDFWNVLITPALSCLSVSLLLYFVFGRASHMR